MARLLLCFAALSALMSADALAGDKKLNGAEIKAAYSDAKTSFTSILGKWFVDWKADGSMIGKDKEGSWPDKGIWWVDGDRFCFKWTTRVHPTPRESVFSPRCFTVTLDGEKTKWWRADGSQMYPGMPMTLTK